MLKTMEKFVGRHIRDEILGLCPLYRHQFAYQPGKSTETRVHHVITYRGEALQKREVILQAFLYINGAFDGT